jgi:hypothetical protein
VSVLSRPCNRPVYPIAGRTTVSSSSPRVSLHVYNGNGRLYPTASLFREPSCFDDRLVRQLVKHIVGMASREGLVERTNVDWQRRRSGHAPHTHRARVRRDNSHAQHSGRCLAGKAGECGRATWRAGMPSAGQRRRGKTQRVVGGGGCALNWL